MRNINFLDTKVGVLGGGQLGKMMGIAAANWHLSLNFLDRSNAYPAGIIGRIHDGDFKAYDDVLNFGREMDIITIEIEHVNTEALFQLTSEGKKVHPNPEALSIIKDKGNQKLFYEQKGLPSAPFQLFEDTDAITEAINHGVITYPFIQKSRLAGYDGKGVSIINTHADLERLLPGPSLIEQKVPIQKEISFIVARNEDGEMKCFPPVEMVFNPVTNLVESLLCPAQIEPAIIEEGEALALETMSAYQICGLLAVEMFLDQDNQLLINEVAPRPHNSGHHTIDSCRTSQFEQHLRAILNLPLGETDVHRPAVMLNLLGTPPYEGKANLVGVEQILRQPGVYLHYYGKEQTSPNRKMGHITVIGNTVEEALQRAESIKDQIKVISTK